MWFQKSKLLLIDVLVITTDRNRKLQDKNNVRAITAFHTEMMQCMYSTCIFPASLTLHVHPSIISDIEPSLINVLSAVELFRSGTFMPIEIRSSPSLYIFFKRSPESHIFTNTSTGPLASETSQLPPISHLFPIDSCSIAVIVTLITINRLID